MHYHHAQLVSRLKHLCYEWFEQHKIENIPENLFVELTLVEAHLVLQSVPAATAEAAQATRDAQKRSQRMALVNGIIQRYPALERQVHADLVSLWAIYK